MWSLKLSTTLYREALVVMVAAVAMATVEREVTEKALEIEVVAATGIIEAVVATGTTIAVEAVEAMVMVVEATAKESYFKCGKWSKRGNNGGSVKTSTVKWFNNQIGFGLFGYFVIMGMCIGLPLRGSSLGDLGLLEDHLCVFGIRYFEGFLPNIESWLALYFIIFGCCIDL